MSTTISQYMGLTVPVVSNEPGPTYASDINSCLTTIDQHNHSPGFGNQINPAGININSDFLFNGNNATTLRSVRFTAQAGVISGVSDVGCLYVASADLYYNDTAGNQVRITSAGGVAGTPGSIGNLTSPASVTYNSGSQTYIFQSTTATAGNIDAGSYILRNITANSHGITLNPPNALASNYSLTLPAALPASTKFLTVDNSGNINDAYDVDNSTIVIASNTIQVPSGGIKQNNRASVQNVLNTSSTAGTLVYTNLLQTFNGNGTWQGVTNGSLTITTVGRPVYLTLSPDIFLGSTTAIGAQAVGSGSIFLRYLRNGNPTGPSILYNGQSPLPIGSYNYIDTPAAGSNVYTLQMNFNGTVTIAGVIMMAFEL